MDSAESLALGELLDQRAIERVLATYARAVDRQDIELLKSCYHPDAINHNAVSRSNAWECAEMLLPLMRQLFSATMHHVTRADVRVQGHQAVAESYFIAWHLVVGGYAEIVTMFGMESLRARDPRLSGFAIRPDAGLGTPRPHRSGVPAFSARRPPLSAGDASLS